MANKKATNSSKDVIKIYPDILLHAIQNSLGNCYRLWTLGKHFNMSGSSFIIKKLFKSFVINDIGIKPSTYYSWRSDCIHWGLLAINKDIYVLQGYARAAILAGCFRVGHPVYIPLEKFVSTKWKAWTWGGFLVSHQLVDRSISRKILEELSGVPERTQRKYHYEAGIIRKSNFAILQNVDGNQEYVDYLNEFEQEKIHSKAFMSYGKVYWRLPNCYFPQNITRGSYTSIKRINMQIKDLINNGGRDPEKLPIVRMYCKSYKQYEKSKRKIQELAGKGQKNLPKILYLESERSGFYKAEYIS